MTLYLTLPRDQHHQGQRQLARACARQRPPHSTGPPDLHAQLTSTFPVPSLISYNFFYQQIHDPCYFANN